MKKTCPCGKKFFCPDWLLDRKKYCSKKCFFIYRKTGGWNKGIKGIHYSPQTEFRKGMTPWNKGTKGLAKANIGSIKKGQRLSIGTEFTREKILGCKNNKWKGRNVGYFALHAWIIRNHGKAKKCEKCGKSKGRIEWANISGKYKRDVKDYKQLCKKCHCLFDKNRWGKTTKLWKLNQKRG